MSSFFDIFKDYEGNWWSHNVVFINISLACIIIALFATIDICAISIIGSIYHYDVGSTILSVGSVATGLITALQGINVWQKANAVKQVFQKDQSQINANPST